MKSERICVAAIMGAFGVRGEVRIKSFCAEPSAAGDYGPVETEDGSARYELDLTRPVKGGFAARLSGVTTKEAADRLRGTRLYVGRERLPDLPDDEYYHTDLIGMEVMDTGGAKLGRVKAVLNHGASDLLEVQVPGGAAVLLPFTHDFVPVVDTGRGRLVVDPPDGIFEHG